MRTTSEERNAEILGTATALVSRACGELPPGSPAEQLRNFTHRAWEILCTPSSADLHRLWVGEVPRNPEVARFYAEQVYGVIHRKLCRIIERGVAEGTFRAVTPHAAARLLFAALLQQAFWCNHADALGPDVAGCCHRTVSETLSVILGGLNP
jgi:TetR/AcrR family transcriptional regulator